MKMSALLKKDTHLFARLNIYIVLSAWGHMVMNALCVCACVKSTIRDSFQTINSDKPVCALQGRPSLLRLAHSGCFFLEACICTPFLWRILACSIIPQLDNPSNENNNSTIYWIFYYILTTVVSTFMWAHFNLVSDNARHRVYDIQQMLNNTC